MYHEHGNLYMAKKYLHLHPDETLYAIEVSGNFKVLFLMARCQEVLRSL